MIIRVIFNSFNSKNCIIKLFLKIVGYNPGEQHLGKSNVSSSGSELPPQAGIHGEPGSHIAGQRGPEILGGKFSD